MPLPSVHLPALVKELQTFPEFYIKGHHPSIMLTNAFRVIYRITESRGSSVSLTTDWTIRFDPRQRQEIFPLTSVSRPAQRPNQPPAQRVHQVLSLGVKRGRGVTLTTHPHLVPRP
jgi:hypothetical protein